MSCIELTLDTTSEAVDWVCTLLASTNYTSDITVTKYTNADSDRRPNNWTHTINFYLPNNTQASVRIQEIENLLSPLHRTALTSTLEAYVIAEKPNKLDIKNEPIQIAERFIVVNSDAVDLPNISERIIIKLKTSLVFGSGLHPATILAIKLLERHITNNMNVLDLGSGSGILSVAAAKLGANVLALDNDAVAFVATQDAITRNDVTDKVRVIQGSLGRGSEMGNWMGGTNTANVSSISPNANFNLIVANILGRIHTTLAPDYRQALHKNGILITSGYDKEYEESVTKALSAQGFEAIDSERLNEWVALTHILHQV
ncbi:ribosomal protein L11 methyltransferase [Dulcicalothrix desertica PCC 7102]|uniref:Ribosomal protein L11 methyltransferase n=1 Tax=Dulcicalothrix desertica PCC 7102 TaxID=232991 RepID=A0A3S1CEZ9_9CYAN|nr:50S ribosomal protein L11 methyltransferase [Dulcicalothrix desertica]RUT00217.1 ribosomal protein L11 methyltransferase [Dulcicalothrix desertica PCC 7102]TWH55685.1 ribosomal protein L11 methyltransferase [Dulcicalothrix desertica PCC 7102]